MLRRSAEQQHGQRGLVKLQREWFSGFGHSGCVHTVHQRIHALLWLERCQNHGLAIAAQQVQCGAQNLEDLQFSVEAALWAGLHF